MTGFYGNAFNNGFNGVNNYMNYPQQPMQRPINYVPNVNQNNFQDRTYQGIKIVESEKILENIDIPMDGNPYYFLKADGTEIYAKFWTEEMKTKVNKFVLVKESDNTNQSKPELDEVIRNYFETLDKNISSRIDSVNENILSLNKSSQRNSKSTKED